MGRRGGSERPHHPRKSGGRRGILALAAVLLLAGLGTRASAAESGWAPRGTTQTMTSSSRVGPKAKHLLAFDRHTALVRFRPGVAARVRAAVAAAGGGRLGAPIHGTGFSIVRIERGTAPQLLGRLRDDPRVADAVPNFIRRAQEDPNDASYWTRQAPLDAVRLSQAWSITHGSRAIRIAIVDTGVDLDHPDLAPRIVTGKDFVNGDGSPDDDAGHGTMVAGIAAATPNNGFGIAGAAWDASIIPVKVLDATGEGTDAEVASGISWAADQGAAVINLSLGGPGDSPVLQQAVQYALAKDALVVAAAGNSASSEPSYPAAYPGVLAVASTDDAGESSSFSNHAPWVDLAAPGEEIFSTVPGDRGTDRYATGSGTSFASPLVTGIAALVRAVNPGWSQTQVASRLEASARDLGPRGIDDSYGHGLVDAAAALGAARQPALPPPRDALEPNGMPDEAKAIGGDASGTISPEGDVDWFYVDVAVAGVWLTFTVNPPPPPDTSFDPVLQAYTPDRRLLVTQDRFGGGGAEQLVVPANTAGRYYLRVSNYQGSRTTTALNTRSDFKSQSYTVAVSQGSAPASRFTPAEVYAAGLLAPDGELETWPQWVAIGDLNADGRNDVVLATGMYVDPENDNKVFVFTQLGDGSLGRPTRIDPGCRGPTAEIGDLNGDGKADLGVACGDSGMKLYFQSGGQLDPATTLPSPKASSFQIVDMNHDGRNDIVSQGSDGIVVATNTGAGFTTRIVGKIQGRVRGGEVTGDGRPDVIAFNPDSATVYVYPQNSDGSFGAAATYAVPSNGWQGSGLEVADVTGDGRADVIAAVEANSPNAAIDVFPQTVAGTLGPASVYAAYDIPQPLAAADVDRDGRNDIVTLHGGWTHAGLLLQSAAGGLQPEELYSIPYATSYPNVAVGDVNGDRAPDIALPDYNHGLVVLRQYARNLPAGQQLWVRGTSPADFASGVATSVVPTIRFARALEPVSVSASTVSLSDGDTGAAVAATRAYDAATQTVMVRPAAALASDKPYVVTINGVRDTSGNAMGEPFAFRFTTTASADVYPPETMIWNGSSGTMSSSGLSFSFVSEERTASFSCSLNGAAFSACTSPAVYSVTPGTYTFQVRAKDAAGNADPTPARRRVVIVAVGQNPPETWFAGSDWPNGNVPSTTATFALGSDASSASLECSLDGAAYVACPTVVSYSGLAPGVHTFSARALSSGMTDPTPLAVAWTVVADTTAPETSIDSGPSGLTASSSVTFSFGASEAGSRFECSLDAAAFAGCSSPASYAGLAEGEHTFRVRAIDAAGNVDATPASRSWTIKLDDRTPPVISLTSPLAGMRVRGSIPLAAQASDDVAVDHVVFSINGSVVGMDSTPPYQLSWDTASIADGAATVVAMAVDSSGNEATVAASVTIDNAPAETFLLSGPPPLTSASWASFTFGASEAASFQCSLDGVAFVACSSPSTHNGLQNGSHSFAVRAVDLAGNVDQTPAASAWTIDTVAPETTITSGPSGTVASGSASFSFAASEAASFQCSLDGAAFSACGSPVGYAHLQDGEHVFLARAIDLAGNTDSTPASRSWVVVLGNGLRPPPVLCHVPKLKGKTVAGAKRLLARAHCRLAAIRSAYSRVRRGRILAQTPRAGTTLPNHGRVSIVVSRGRRR